MTKQALKTGLAASAAFAALALAFIADFRGGQTTDGNLVASPPAAESGRLEVLEGQQRSSGVLAPENAAPANDEGPANLIPISSAVELVATVADSAHPQSSANPSQGGEINPALIDKYRPREILKADKSATPQVRIRRDQFVSLCAEYRRKAASEFDELRIKALLAHPKVRMLDEDCPDTKVLTLGYSISEGLNLGGPGFHLTLTAKDYQNAVAFNQQVSRGSSRLELIESIRSTIWQTENYELIHFYVRAFLELDPPGLERSRAAIYAAFEANYKLFRIRMAGWAAKMVYCTRYPVECGEDSWTQVSECLEDHFCYQVEDFWAYRKGTLTPGERAYTDLIFDALDGEGGADSHRNSAAAPGSR